jgi:hypothetical protein
MREMAAIEALKSEKADKEVEGSHSDSHMTLLLTVRLSSETSNN